MKNASILIAAAFLAVALIVIILDNMTLASNETASTAPALTDANYATEVTSSSIPVIIDFNATWCGPCRQMSPDVDALAKLYAGKVKVLKCDIDQNPTLQKSYGITSVPTIVVISKKGKVTVVGKQSLSQLKKMAEDALKP